MARANVLLDGIVVALVVRIAHRHTTRLQRKINLTEHKAIRSTQAVQHIGEVTLKLRPLTIRLQLSRQRVLRSTISICCISKPLKGILISAWSTLGGALKYGVSKVNIQSLLKLSRGLVIARTAKDGIHLGFGSGHTILNSPLQLVRALHIDMMAVELLVTRHAGESHLNTIRSLIKTVLLEMMLATEEIIQGQCIITISATIQTNCLIRQVSKVILRPITALGNVLQLKSIATEEMRCQTLQRLRDTTVLIAIPHVGNQQGIINEIGIDSIQPHSLPIKAYIVADDKTLLKYLLEVLAHHLLLKALRPLNIGRGLPDVGDMIHSGRDKPTLAFTNREDETYHIITVTPISGEADVKAGGFSIEGYSLTLFNRLKQLLGDLSHIFRRYNFIITTGQPRIVTIRVTLLDLLKSIEVIVG